MCRRSRSSAGLTPRCDGKKEKRLRGHGAEGAYASRRRLLRSERFWNSNLIRILTESRMLCAADCELRRSSIPTLGTEPVTRKQVGASLGATPSGRKNKAK